MNVGSLFSGIGGLDLGLERAGLRVVWQCEADEYRRAVLRERFGGTIHEDVRDVCVGEPTGGSQADPVHLRHHERRREAGAGLPDGVDLLCGGFPCQDLSVAGKRKGLDGERSGLFFEFARIAESLRPEWVLVENVPGLLSSNGGRDFGELLGTLADLGYGVAWRTLNSQFFGVPQCRRRVFILAHAGGDTGAERASEVLAVGQGCDRHPGASGEKGEDAAYALTTRPAARLANEDNYVVNPEASVRRLTPRECERPQGLPDDWTLVDWNGKPATDTRRYAAIGDAVTVNVAEWIGSRLDPPAPLTEPVPSHWVCGKCGEIVYAHECTKEKNDEQS